MSIFGWSYPPGCSGPPDDDRPCEVCGRNVDDCICPECPSCGEVGNPFCYELGMGHWMQKTPEQIASYHAMQEHVGAELMRENELYDLHKEE